MRLVLLGPPGAGKGTQAAVLAGEYKIPHISTGDILREAVKTGSQIGKEAKEYMNKGELVPDDVVTKIVVERLSKEDATKGFILDGYPRTVNQAESLSSALDTRSMAIDKVLYLKTSPSTVVKRLSGRRICRKCSAIFHVKNSPPKKEGVCDKCGSELYQRPDDKEDTITNRLRVYNETEQPLLDYYRSKNRLKEVSGDLEVKELFDVLADYFGKEGL